MFEAAELGHEIGEEEYEAREPVLRADLLQAQYELKQRGDFPVILVMSGLDGAGKGETVKQLVAWMDPRLLETQAFGSASEAERERPRLYRYWRALPPKGKLGIFFGGWYADPMQMRVEGRIKGGALDNYLEEIVRFEALLAKEGALVVKFYMHLSEQRQKKRLRSLEKDPHTRWRVTDTDWDNFELYDKWRKVADQTIRQTSVAEAPWHVVDGADHRYRTLTVGTALLAAMRKRLDQKDPEPVTSPPMVTSLDRVEVLDKLDLNLRLEKKKYEKELEEWQGRVNVAMRSWRFAKAHSAVVVFEGNDAAGKGGAIRRITAALDPRQYDVVPIAAPTEEERAQPYLWRFYRRLPRRGKMTLFDRSWYGRVLVERVEGFATEEAYLRAYGEINDFEEQIRSAGGIVVKFWLAIDKETQLARFKEREETRFKKYKIGPEDYRNRDKWDAYAAAVNDMVERTSTRHAPWTLVEANDKHYARIKVLRTIAEALEKVL